MTLDDRPPRRPDPSWPPLREELRGLEPYGAPQLHGRPCCSTSTRIPTSGRRRGGRHRGLGGTDRRTLNRYPEREFTALREALAAYLGHGVTAEQMWAANGSNEVMLHLLLAFAGPGRLVLSFAPTYSMYPEYARDTHSAWVTGHRDEDFTLDPAYARDLVRGPPAVGRAAALAQQPHGHGASAADGVGALRGRGRPGSWSSTRRTTSSAGPARPAPWSCCPSTATWS